MRFVDGMFPNYNFQLDCFQKSWLPTIESKRHVRQPAAPRFQAEFVTKVKIVRERLSSREQETTGKWYTEEKLKSCGEYAPCLGRKTTMGDYVFTNNLVFKHIFVNIICVKMRLWLMNTQMYISFTCMFNFYVHTCMYQRNFCDFNQHMMCVGCWWKENPHLMQICCWEQLAEHLRLGANCTDTVTNAFWSHDRYSFMWNPVFAPHYIWTLPMQEFHQGHHRLLPPVSFHAGQEQW